MKTKVRNFLNQCKDCKIRSVQIGETNFPIALQAYQHGWLNLAGEPFYRDGTLIRLGIKSLSPEGMEALDAEEEWLSNVFRGLCAHLWELTLAVISGGIGFLLGRVL